MLEMRRRRGGVLGGLLGAWVLQACSGADGAIGAPGPEGAVGAAAHDALVAGQRFDTLEGCPSGGVTLSMGTDDGSAGGTADNGVLEAGEIDDTENLCDGPAGPDGIAGPGGPAGATGAIGAIGPGGATGAAGDPPTLGVDGLVPYASGDPIEMTTLGGEPDDVALPGFGTWGQISNVADLGTLDLTGAPGRLLNTAFIVPFDATITTITGFFSTTTSLALGASSLDYGVALYAATGGDNTFEVIVDSVAGFTALTGSVDPGTTDSFEFSPLTPIPLAAGTRLLMTVAASSSDSTLDATLQGYFSGGLQLEELTP